MSTAYSAPSFSIIEADDMMEVSSENGHNAGDEDIDIDLDLSASHVDEDYILDDAASNNDMDDDLQAAGHDQSMFDGQNDQYQVYDEDLNEEFGLDQPIDNMEQEAIVMPFGNATSSSFQVGNQNVDTTTPFDKIDNEPEKSSTMAEITTSTIKTPDPLFSEAAARPEMTHHSNSIENTVSASSQNVSLTTAPNDHTSIRPDHPQSPPITSPKTPDHIDTRSTSQHESAYIPESEATIEISGSLSDFSYREVIVTYQDSEYALFPSSESDDPDSFFLSDFSVIDKPLASFFEAIRDVIHDDITDDDNLYIQVEDLNLEIMETNASTYQALTFGQILNLHSKLLQNDGVESPGAFYLHLGTNLSLSRRFADLSKLAAEGKGLSEVVYRNDDHGSSNGVEDGEDDHLEPDELASKTQELAEFDDEIDNPDKEPLNPSFSRSPVNVTGNIPVSAAATLSVPINSTSTGVAEDLAETIVDKEGNNEHDDGDLIDYSDEELDNTPHNKLAELRRLSADTSRTENEEYQAKNEELRRSSLSRAAEDNALEQQIKFSGILSTNEDNTKTDLHAESRTTDDFDHHSDENDSVHLDEVHDDQQKDSYKFIDTEVSTSGNSDGLRFNDEVNSHKQHDNDSEGHSLATEFLDEFETEGHEPSSKNDNELFDDGIEFGEDFTISNEFLGLTGAESGISFGLPPGDSNDLIKGSTEIDTGTSDAAELETVESEKTLEAQPGDENEINYDDDDDDDDDNEEKQDTLEEEDQPHSPNPQEVPTFKPGSGKRLRAEEASDDGINTRNKEAKRSKS